MTAAQRFVGRTAIVTGGSRGIGRATARQLTAQGARVAILARDRAVAEGAAAELAGARAYAVDVSDSAAVAAAVAEIGTAWGGIDILVNNAGGSMKPRASFWEMPIADMREIVDVNVFGQLLVTREALPFMLDRDAPAIVNVVSMSGIQTVPMMAAYGAAKAALINFTNVMAKELGDRNVRVNAVAPGYTRFDGEKANFDAAGVERLETLSMQRQMLKRICVPDDIAAAILFLCSPDARMITGQVLPVNGGAL